NCDDLGYGDLACYGSPVNKTPYLDKMAEEGVRFTDYHVMSPVCSASRAAMLTGCYPQRVGINGVLFPGDAIGLSPDEITLADVLKGQGYRTKIVGKWHCGDQPEFLPTHHGFDEYYGLPYSNDMGIQGKPENLHKRVPLPLLRDEDVIQEQPDQRGLTERYTEECVRFIRDQKEGPFFLYLAHMYVHVPLFVPNRFLKQAENGGYGGAVECIDWVAGVIFDELQRQGLDDNTMVIFTSDNGSRARGEGGSNAPLRGTKFQTWEGGQRVPCIVRYPGKVPAGRICDDLVTSMDFMPTFARMTGTTEPQDRVIDGKDISPLIFGDEGATSPHESFWYYRLDNLEAVRRGKWKLHFAKGKAFDKADEGVDELYDLDQDIGEEHNLFDDHPEIVEALKAEAERARQDLGDVLTGDEGSGKREVGRVENPKPLATYDENHPYIVAAYDTPDTKVMGG
ncbi:MAG: sulfatase, partial [Verrucomicrobia bacterium]|nr:sulfatase [Verrucomicrobiota bacterium]